MTIAAVLEGKGSDVATIAAEAPVRAAVAVLSSRNIGALPVVEGGRILGMLSERDVVRCLEEHGGAILDSPVSRVMTTPVITVDSETPVLSALALMTSKRVRHLPVTDGGAIRGIVSIGDLVKYRMERIEAEAEAMRSYIQSA